jgi:hypothetical protein
MTATRLEISTHEAAHVIAAKALGVAVESVSISAEGGSTFIDDGDTMAMAVVAAAGRIGTEAILGYYTEEGCHGDAEVTERMLTALGQNHLLGRAECAAGAHNLVHKHRRKIRRLARALRRKGALTGAEIDELLIQR